MRQLAHNTKQLGVTLIEMALVIGIMAVLIVTVAMWTQSHYKQEQVHRAKLDMEQWLQASAAYYEKNHAWPTQAKLISDGYIESTMQTNPWGKQYTLSIIKIKDVERMQVATTTLNDAQAKQLAMTLPAGEATSTTVTSRIVTPEEATAEKGYIIKEIKTVTPGTPDATFPMPSCPVGYNAGVFSSLADIENNKAYSFVRTWTTRERYCPIYCNFCSPFGCYCACHKYRTVHHSETVYGKGIYHADTSHTPSGNQVTIDATINDQSPSASNNDVHAKVQAIIACTPNS